MAAWLEGQGVDEMGSLVQTHVLIIAMSFQDAHRGINAYFAGGQINIFFIGYITENIACL